MNEQIISDRGDKVVLFASIIVAIIFITLLIYILIDGYKKSIFY